MFSNKLILEIIKSDLSIMPGIVKIPENKDIIIDGKEINIRVQLMSNINIGETSKLILNQLRFKLVDKIKNKDFNLNIIVYI